MKASSLTLGFSTLQSNVELFKTRLDKLVHKISQCNETDGVEIIVVIQGSESDSRREENGVRFVYSTTYGLSISRNIVIDESRSEYIWFLDDDIEFTQSQVEYLLVSVAQSSKDLILGRIRCSDSPGFYKNYNIRSKSKLWMLKCSSIEIIVKREFLIKENIRFNNFVGLGTEFPTGEENLFLLECREKNATKLFLESDIVSHPCLDAARNKFREKTLRERMCVQGYICKQLGFFTGLFLFIFWGYKFSLSHMNVKVPLWMAKGLFLKF